MLNCIKKHFLLVLILLLGGIPASLNYSGFCISQGRYLSDEEKIRIVIISGNSQDTIPVEIEKEGHKHWQENYKQIKYKDVNEFFDKNPDCCKVNGGGPYDLGAPSFFDRITGYDSGDVVTINARANYIDENGNKQSIMLKSDSVLTNCGQMKR